MSKLFGSTSEKELCDFDYHYQDDNMMATLIARRLHEWANSDRSGFKDADLRFTTTSTMAVVRLGVISRKVQITDEMVTICRQLADVYFNILLPFFPNTEAVREGRARKAERKARRNKTK